MRQIQSINFIGQSNDLRNAVSLLRRRRQPSTESERRDWWIRKRGRRKRSRRSGMNNNYHLINWIRSVADKDTTINILLLFGSACILTVLCHTTTMDGHGTHSPQERLSCTILYIPSLLLLLLFLL